MVQKLALLVHFEAWHLFETYIQGYPTVCQRVLELIHQHRAVGKVLETVANHHKRALFCRLDRVYYGNRLDDTKHVLDLAPLFQFVATPIDQRSTTVEQIKGKEAYDVITKWANDPNLNAYLIAKLKSETKN